MKQTINGDFNFVGRGMPYAFVSTTTLITSRIEGNNAQIKGLHLGPFVFAFAWPKQKEVE